LQVVRQARKRLYLGGIAFAGCAAYLHSASTGYSPRLGTKENWPAFGAFLREFAYLWKANAPG
jgi:hypothetical protein